MKKIEVFEKEAYKDLGDLYGLFFEDINHAADGGLYAELIQNRSFEYCEIDRKEYTPLTAWSKSEGIEWEVIDTNPLNNENKHYLHVKANANDSISNEGYKSGIFVEEGKKYDFSLFAKGNGKIKVECGGVLELKLDSNEWKKYEGIITANKTFNDGKLVITFENAGQYDLDMISLFPEETFNNKKNGLRKDIAEALKEMHPKFMRFPGGCLTHDGSLDKYARNSLYRWERTIGKVEERPTWRNNWGYNQTLGLGYFEYFCFCEEIGAAPLPVLAGGFNPHKGEGVPMEKMQEWVDEALHLIEFANGDENSEWGKKRIELGHKEPFNLKYIGIGNEEIGQGFFERYPLYHEAIRKKYPEIKIINTAGPFAVGEGYEDGWRSAKKYGSDLVDEHYYSSPEWFLANMHHYEDFDEKGPHVFLGEYASWGNTFYNAIVEAAYMTGLEKAKAVDLACYAPMLCNVNYVNWAPDMLWFDNHRIAKTPNYYVQKMFMTNQGTKEVKTKLTDLDEIIPVVDAKNISGNIIIERNDTEGKIYDIKVTDLSENKTVNFDETVLNEANPRIDLGNVVAKNYTLEFKFKRSLGRKGLKIFFGQRNPENTLLWEFGGWDNWDCNIASSYNRRFSTISHRIFHVEDIEYTLKLEVRGRNIKTFINGINWNDVTDRLPEIEELYTAASIDETTGETIVKVVNLTGEEKMTDVSINNSNKANVKVISLKSDSLTAENTLDKPDTVVPIEFSTTASKENDNVTYKACFAPHSVTVLKFN